MRIKGHMVIIMGVMDSSLKRKCPWEKDNVVDDADVNGFTIPPMSANGNTGGPLIVVKVRNWHLTAGNTVKGLAQGIPTFFFLIIFFFHPTCRDPFTACGTNFFLFILVARSHIHSFFIKNILSFSFVFFFPLYDDTRRTTLGDSIRPICCEPILQVPGHSPPDSCYY